MGKPRLLYLAPQMSSFVQKDIDILESSYNVMYSGFMIKGPLSHLRAGVLQAFFLLRFIYNTQAIVIMFGGYHAFLPSLLGKVFGKRVYIILGGTDCVSFPSIGYGTFRKKIQGRVTCLSYRLSTMLLPVHRSLIHREDTYYTIDSKFQGCKHWCRNLNTPFVEIYNGYDSDKWSKDHIVKTANSFVTIAAIPDPSKLVLKGVDIIVELAQLFPNCQFTIIGLQDQNIHVSTLPNVLILPFLPPEKLLEILSTNQFYLQLSISEGFPNALCEAMLAQCVPIGSNVAAIPDIIGDTGFLLKKREISMLQDLVTNAIQHPNLSELGKLARHRISTLYTIENRSQKLVDVLHGQ
ncbi:MAG: glycosyltransferase [Flavobacteriales bacterium]|jgi:glycosyltransferase involved in cell wall biosynthesis|nr:glycosyltransferase [Flavobacteriales bacterium]